MSGNKEQIDVSLIGNDKIEEAIVNIQKEPTEENLVRALSIVKHRMNDKGQLIIAVEPPLPDGKLNLKVIKTEDGQMWWIAYTSFDEELKGADNIKSTFLTDIDKLLNSALQVDEISGIIINPWNKTLMIDKELINLYNILLFFSYYNLYKFFIKWDNNTLCCA